MRKTLVSAAAAALFVVSVGVAGGGAAYADTNTAPVSASSDSSAIVGAGQTSTVTLPDGSELTTTLGLPSVVSADEIRLNESLTSVQKDELVERAAAGAVMSNHYSQFTTGGAYTVTHNGTFFYDGERTWVTDSYRGYTGSHECFINYAGGVSITNIGCSESGTPTERWMYMSWTVGVGPAAYGVDMTAKLYADGNISGFGATVG